MSTFTSTVRILLIATSIGFASGASAQGSSDYAALKQREIKALSIQQVDDLREGRGMGLSLPAELNGAPGPLHALELRDALALTPEQASTLELIRDRMKQDAQRLGLAIIDAEARLDQAFRSRTIDEAGLRAMTSTTGMLNAELRAVHLLAHLKTRRLLTDRQVAAYDAARGDAEGAADGRTGHPGHRH